MGIDIEGVSEDPEELLQRAQATRKEGLQIAHKQAIVARASNSLLLCSFFNGIQYGEWFKTTTPVAWYRLPFGMLQGELEPQLLFYLPKESPFNDGEYDLPSLREDYGLQTDKNKAGEPPHFAKADWHTMPG